MGSTEFVSILAALADMALRPGSAHQHLRKSRKVSQSFEKYHNRPCIAFRSRSGQKNLKKMPDYLDSGADALQFFSRKKTLQRWQVVFM